MLRADWGTQDVAVGATLGIHILGLEEAESNWAGGVGWGGDSQQSTFEAP